ncbi:MAG: leucyl aminopeptidase family protein, partial [Pararhodobacter sp.]|nr:leucyl aminopeptidase family protein [Pararhodobacter sp.]
MRQSHTAFAAPDSASIPLHCVSRDALADWLENQPARVRGWIEALGFSCAAGSLVCVPDASGALSMAVFGTGDAKTRARGRMGLGGARAQLPVGTYHLAGGIEQADLPEHLLGWLLAGYRFDRFRQRRDNDDQAALKAPDGVDARRIEVLAAAECLTRDLINTPASQMGPEELETTVLALAEEFDAQVSVTYGDDLLHENFPLIHAVGRASGRIPRLVDLRWGQEGPRVTLVGKGVCFDTGGLNIKPGASMGLMKKDMGGAATVLGLA